METAFEKIIVASEWKARGLKPQLERVDSWG